MNCKAVYHLIGEMNGNILRIGNTTAQIRSRHNLEALVPDVLFYENQQVYIYI